MLEHLKGQFENNLTIKIMENLTIKQKELLEFVNTEGALRKHLIGICSLVLDSGASSEYGLTPSACEDLFFCLHLADIIADIEPK